MPLWLLNNWKSIASAACAIVLCFGLHMLAVHALEVKHRAALVTQQIKMITSCEADKRITLETSYDYEQSLSVLADRLVDARRVSKHVCVVPTSKPAARHNDAAPDTRFSETYGVPATAFIDYAGDAEAVGLQLDATQRFIRDVWAAKSGQE